MDQYNVYIVTMCKYSGALGKYTLGAFSSLEKACKHAKSEESFRGIKYTAIIEEVTIDEEYNSLNSPVLNTYNSDGDFLK